MSMREIQDWIAALMSENSPPFPVQRREDMVMGMDGAPWCGFVKMTRQRLEKPLPRFCCFKAFPDGGSKIYTAPPEENSPESFPLAILLRCHRPVRPQFTIRSLPAKEMPVLGSP